MPAPCARFDAAFAEHARVLDASRTALAQPFARLVAVCGAALAAGGKIVFFGNGGSAAQAQHLAAELAVRYARDRAPIAALALTSDSAVLTACANDLGYECVFARQVEALCTAADVCIGLTTSGRSANVLAGLRAARARGGVAAALAGGDGGDLPGLAAPLLIVPSAVTARIQEMHLLLGHMLCQALEDAGGAA